ncbi:F-box protein PP2-B11 [Glycine soja]|uniref:F-box protein PP2-B11 n=1 Tax=Glycine soja TaxID=3848 RepID=A0A445L6V5_GLYSO|nr:F-box protein PP2-B11 [Glycine soja]
MPTYVPFPFQLVQLVRLILNHTQTASINGIYNCSFPYSFLCGGSGPRKPTSIFFPINKSNSGSCVQRELLRTVLEFKIKTVCFKSSLVHTPPTTLVAISPVIKEIEQQNNELQLPKEELQSLIRKMEEGRQLVFECSKIRWLHFVTWACYKDKLDRFSDELKKLFAIDMQAQKARDQRRHCLRAISALRWIFPTLIRVAFTFSSTKQGQFSLDIQLKRKKGYLLSARSLTVFWGEGDTPRYWGWTVPGVRYLEVTEIVSVSWLKILGRIKTAMLSPNTLYGAYLVFKESSDGA